MSRNVVPNSMIAHLWANQSQPSARSQNGNFWFYGPALYSYSTPIGYITQGVDGQRVALITCEKYSPTTAGKHLAPASRAVSYEDFRVPCLGVTWGRGRPGPAPSSWSEVHSLNLAHLRKRYDDAKAKALRAPYDSWRAASIAGDLANYRREVTRYADAFGLDEPTFSIADDLAAIAARFERLRLAKETPEYLTKQARIAAAREAKEAEQRRIDRLSFDERMAAWLDGLDVRPPLSYHLSSNTPVRLRIKGDDLETSLGATVPLAHAIRVFHAVKRCKLAGQGWQRNGHTLHVGHFQVDRIEPNGDFHAGCHFIQWDEVERVAKLADVFDDEAETATAEA